LWIITFAYSELEWCHEMARDGNINIGSVFEEYLQKEQQFEQEIEKRYIYVEI